MLTGDSKKIADHIGKQVGVDKIYSELLPEDKVQRLEEILQRSNKKTAFVGAKPKAPKASTNIFIPIAKTMFCLTIFNVFFANRIASAIFDG